MIDSDRVPSALGHKTDTISQSSRATLEPFMNEQYYGHGKCMCGWTDKNVALVSRPQAGLTKKGRKRWEYHTQALLTKVGSDGVPHTGSADKGRKWWEYHTQPVLTKKGRNWLDHHAEADQWIESHFVQTRDVLTGVVFRHTDESDLFKIVMCLYPSRLQKHSQWNLISPTQGYVGSSRLLTQSVECEQLKPGVYWSRSSSDTVSGMWTVETRCILIQVVFWHSQWNLISSNQEHARCQVISDTATGASDIEPSAGWTVRHHALHVPYTGGQQERGFLKTREEKKKKKRKKHRLSTEA